MCFILFLFYVFVCPSSFGSDGCPRKCVCEHGNSVRCFRVQVVPSAVSKGTRKLNLGYSQLKDLTNLEEIVVSSCGVEVVETDTFKQQGLLKTLELAKNKLTDIPCGLPHSLEVLNLGNNRIQSIQDSCFEGLRKLRVLDLQKNLINSLWGSTLISLVKLEFLHLDGNGIETVQGSLRLPLLKLLSLADNKISSLPPFCLAPLMALTTLQLQGNLLTRVPQDLPRSLISLNLNQNQIKVLKTRELGHLRRLTKLSVSQNRLASVDGNLRLPNLTTLELWGNQLRVVPGRLAPRLETLDCKQNSIQEVTHYHLCGLRHLRHLFLENNTIQHFEAIALKNCIQLTNLALEQNLLSTIPEGLPESLVRLDLKGNCIETIRKQEVRPLKRLQVLNLRNNRLSSLDHSTVELLPELRKLFLDGNPWNCSCELLRVKRSLLARRVEIRTELCDGSAHPPGDDWRAHLRAQNICEDYLRQTAPAIQGQSSMPIDHTDHEEYYDYDSLV
uniref:Nephrocan-like n=1 Tax=Scleropages formosus TaxID=113540 RepID=A0A8C9TYV4_SCLFO